jgi:hypothetical protein
MDVVVPHCARIQLGGGKKVNLRRARIGPFRRCADGSTPNLHGEGQALIPSS